MWASNEEHAGPSAGAHAADPGAHAAWAEPDHLGAPGVPGQEDADGVDRGRAPLWTDDLELAGLWPDSAGTQRATMADPSIGAGSGSAAPGRAPGGLRASLASPGPALDFARRHLAVIVVALVVGVGIAATHLFRAGTQAVPVSASIASPASTASTDAGSSGHAAVVHPASSASPSATGSGAGTPVNPNLTVQVLGPVRHPGVVTLHPGSRVKDAIMVCGGLLSSADPGELNLAAPLQDADQVIIGTRGHPRGEVRQGTSGQDTGTPDATVTASAGASSTGSTVVVNLNTATLAQLDAIPGVGPVTAQKIIDWRTQHGRFSSANELQEVDGIGAKTFARIAPHVTV